MCRRRGALLIVDEAHGLGVRGTGGRGLLHEVGLAGAEDVVMTTTLSKALGSQGGVALGPVAVRDHLIDAARSFIFDTGLTPAAVGAAWAALRVLVDEPWRATAVLAHAEALAEMCDVAAATGLRGGVGDPRRARGGAGGGHGLSAAWRSGGLFPPAHGAGGYVAVAAYRQGVAGRRRYGVGSPGVDGSARPRVSVLVVTGTDTGIGKTVATAALGCHARLAGIDVAVCKPVQTGTADGDDDLGDVARLAGVTELHGSWRYPEPLAPAAAAQRAGLPLPTRRDLGAEVAAADRARRLTLVEGAGGLLVELGEGGVTLRDLALDLAAPVLVVVSAGLGTLNHTALTLEALASHNVWCAGLVIGAWPRDPGPVEVGNRDALARLAPLRAVLPAGAGALARDEFETMSASAFDPEWVASLVG